MSVLQQGLIVVDADYELTSDKCKDITINSKTDTDPGIHLGLQAIVGTLWWFLSMFVYVKNDTEIQTSTNQATVPLIWFWANLADGTYGWTAAAYFANFWVFLIVSVGEFVTWCFYLAGMPKWFSWWIKNVGYTGSMYGALIPVIFAAFQLGFSNVMGGLAGDDSFEFGFNSVFLITMGLTVWFQSAMVHYVFAERLHCYVDLNPRTIVKKEIECPLKQRIGQTEEDYQKACQEIFKASKAKAIGRAAAEATPDIDEDADLESLEEDTEAPSTTEGNAW